MCEVSALNEICSFFLIHAFGLKPPHTPIVMRQVIVGVFCGIPGTPEWYEFISGKTKRIGPNTCTIFAITVLELGILLRYGRRFGEPYSQKVLPWSVGAPIACFVVLYALTYAWYCRWYALKVPAALRLRSWRDRTPPPIPPYVLRVRWLTVVPLLSLCRFWKF